MPLSLYAIIQIDDRPLSSLVEFECTKGYSQTSHIPQKSNTYLAM